MTTLRVDPSIDEWVTRLERAGLVLVARQRTPWQPWMDGFLNALARRNGNARLASEEVEVSRRTIYNYRGTCKEFRDRWRDVLKAIKQSRAKPQAEAGE